MPGQLNSDIAIQAALKQAQTSSHPTPTVSDKAKAAGNDLEGELNMSRETLKQVKTNPSYHEAFIKALIAELEEAYEMCSREKSESKIEEVSHDLAIHAY